MRSVRQKPGSLEQLMAAVNDVRENCFIEKSSRISSAVRAMGPGQNAPASAARARARKAPPSRPR